MAFIVVPKQESYEERIPILSYDAKAGRMFLIDRVQNGEEWETAKTDVTMTQPQFAVDFGRLQAGWALFQAGQAPLWELSYYGNPLPACPPSPGNDAKGKPLRYKTAFRVLVMGQQIKGLRELGGNSASILAGINELHTAFESAPESVAGKIPLVKMTNVLPIKSGQSTNYQPVFTIQSWVDRPAPLGERMVPVSVKAAPPIVTQPAFVAPAATMPTAPSGHVPPPAAVITSDEMPF